MTGALLLVLGGVALAWRVHAFGQRPGEPVRSGAIVVLGAKVNPDGTAGPALSARVEHAVALLRAGHGEWLLFSGRGAGPTTEAEAARAHALAAGVEAERCMVESESQSTFENARCVAKQLQARGVGSVVLVTDDFHVYRAVSHFRRAGLVVSPSPVRRSLSLRSRLGWTGRELLALVRRPWLLH